jgi:hypothetical protein
MNTLYNLFCCKIFFKPNNKIQPIHIPNTIQKNIHNIIIILSEYENFIDNNIPVSINSVFILIPSTYNKINNYNIKLFNIINNFEQDILLFNTYLDEDSDKYSDTYLNYINKFINHLNTINNTIKNRLYLLYKIKKLQIDISLIYSESLFDIFTDSDIIPIYINPLR